MNVIRQILQQLTTKQLMVLALLLCIPAFLINLGAVAFIGDEAIRSLVALEMKLSGNFLVPTLNGEAYYNKPPLYNWFIYGASMLAGYFGEWPSRLTTVFFLGVFAAAVYFFSKKRFSTLTAFTLAMMLLTSGRILFWDSMLGLIDICFSAVIFTNFMVLYHFGEKKKYWHFFIYSYLLFAIAFLLKGLPAIVFQCISVLAALLLHGEFRRKLISLPHLAGIGAGILLLMGYYIPYAREVPIEKVLSILFDQSMQRTATHHGLWKTVEHAFTFPFEQLYHFLPWSILVMVYLHPSFRKRVNADPFLKFNFWMLVANIPVYWLSVQVYPRYLLMFIPLFNVIGYVILMQMMEERKWMWRLVRIAFGVALGVLTVVMILLPAASKAREAEGIWWIWPAGALLMIFCFFGWLYNENKTVLWLCIGLLVTRSVFNVVVLPDRSLTFHENHSRNDCRRLAERHGDQPWFIYGKSETHQVARFYTAAFKNEIIYRTSHIKNAPAYYLVNTKYYGYLKGEVIDTLLLEGHHQLSLMQLSPVQEEHWTFRDIGR